MQSWLIGVGWVIYGGQLLGRWFHDAWHGSGDWERVKITAEQCPRISRAFLEAQKQKMPERCFLQEYYNAFLEPFDSVFREEDIDRLVDPNIKPLFNW